jgi:hypothetical protein
LLLPATGPPLLCVAMPAVEPRLFSGAAPPLDLDGATDTTVWSACSVRGGIWRR